MESEINIKIQTLKQKIKVESKLLEGGENMLKQLTDKTLVTRCETNIFKSRQRLDYLEVELLKYTEKNKNTKVKPKQAKLGPIELRKCESQLTSQKITFKVHEIVYKLNVETKLREGTIKLSKIYSQDPTSGDKKSRQEVSVGLIQTNEKLQLLNKALKQYQELEVGKCDSSEEDEEDIIWKKPGNRRPVSGHLELQIKAIKNIGYHKQQTTYIAVKVDSALKHKTKVNKTDLYNENIRIEIDKACEIEMMIYAIFEEKHIPQGIVWFPLSELADEARKNVAMSTSRMELNNNFDKLNISDQQQNAIEAWFDVEPVGAIDLKMRFNKNKLSKKRISRLGRKGALKKNKGEIVEQNGHSFVPLQFYQLMKCAFCTEFLINSVGYQCDHCRYFCHKRCVEKIFLKCISKVSSESQLLEDKINHKIPHRFEDITNIGANWCSHCGYMMNFGKRNSKRCSECQTSAHSSCMHLVPDFCGITMALANEILREIKIAKNPRSSQLRHSASGSSKVPTTPPLSTQKKDKKPSSPRLSKRISLNMPLFKSSKNKDQKQPTKFNISIDNFKFLAVLGKGNFGKVMLSEEKSTGRHYAIKVLKKNFILESDEIEGTNSEKRVFLIANNERHPFLVGLHSCFQTSSRIYFVMEYVSGGDLMWHIQHQTFGEHRAKFYACEVLLALEYFHKNNIVYRDLKLDNILLGLDGHIKIADYGLCKENMPYKATTGTFCGTPEFMAPEILLEQKYTRSVDWWAFGVLMYEMILGQSPFHGEDEDEIFDAILEDEILYPYTLPKKSVSILQQLLERDPTKRLGSGPDDAVEIKDHEYFRGVEWEKFLKKEMKPPYIPKLKSKLDISHFDTEFTNEKPMLTPQNSVISNSDQMKFKGFEYMAEWVNP